MKQGKESFRVVLNSAVVPERYVRFKKKSVII
jgi:hypothetical protein